MINLIKHVVVGRLRLLRQLSGRCRFIPLICPLEYRHHRHYWTIIEYELWLNSQCTTTRASRPQDPRQATLGRLLARWGVKRGPDKDVIRQESARIIAQKINGGCVQVV